MRIPLFVAVAAALLVVGCYVEEPPRYAHQGQARTCSSPVVVNYRYPTAPGVRTPPPGVRTPPLASQRRCFFRRARWVRVWQGWRRVEGRWSCRRGAP